MPTIRRLPDGRPDRDCPIVQALTVAVEEIAALKDPVVQEQAIVALLPALAEARWAEVFVVLAWPELEIDSFAPFHLEAWKWFTDIGDDTPPALVACWPRGGAKSTTVGLMLALACLIGLRDYCLWVGAREKAITDKVSGVGALLASPRVRAAFPSQTETYQDAMTGVKVDWRQGRIATASGFALDAVGMDQALRGALRLSQRPGIIVLDDIESTGNSAYIRERIADQVTKAILPAGSDNAAMCWIQNRLHDSSLMSSMLDGKLDWFRRRVVSGPWPQIRGMEVELEENGDGDVEYVIVAGEATWPAGAGVAVSQAQMNIEGESSFRMEKNHESDADDGDKFPKGLWRYVDVAPSGLRVCRSWDLAATEGGGDWTVGALWGIDKGGRGYVLDVVRGQWGPDRVEDEVRDTAEDDIARFGRCPVLVEAQPAAAGKSWNERWKNEVLVGFEVHLIPPKGNKEYRTDGYSAHQRRGMMTLVSGSWNDAWTFEHRKFKFKDGKPLHKHDDQVDAGSQGFNWLTGKVRRSKGSLSSPARRTLAG